MACIKLNTTWGTDQNHLSAVVSLLKYIFSRHRLLFPALIFLCVFSTPAVSQDTSNPKKKNDPALDLMISADQQVIHSIRQNLSEIIESIILRKDLFPRKNCNAKRMTTQEQRKEIRTIWQNFLDNIMALDNLGSKYESIYRNISLNDKKPEHFQLAHAAFIMQYRYCLDFIALVEKDACQHIILNEADQKLGIPEDTYTQLKLRFLNVGRGVEFIRLNAAYQFYKTDEDNALGSGIKEDTLELFKAGVGKGTFHTVKNGLKLVQELGFTAWFPIQKGVSQWMGDTKVFRPKNVLIQESQIEALLPELEPGDIFLERREWYLSNIGLPGYWTHAALFIGTPEQRETYFNHPDIKKWLKKAGRSLSSFNDLIRSKFPHSYAESTRPQSDGHIPMVIEAISEGVVFTTVQHSLAADSIAVLRPRLSKKAKAQAILTAFKYNGSPYDFNFNFLTDSELVCTELIYKSYESSSKKAGLELPMRNMLGRSILSANQIAELYAKELNTRSQQFSFICFLDGYEQAKKAIRATKADFKESWRRSKWHNIIKAPAKSL